MKLEDDLRERLRAVVERLAVDAPPLLAIEGRGRRLRAAQTTGGLVAGLAVAAGVVWSLTVLAPIHQGTSVVDRRPGGITRFDMGGRPIRRVAVGGGAAWIIVQRGGSGRLILARLDDRTGSQRTIDGIGEPQQATYGFGSVWVATCLEPEPDGGCPDNRILRLDPADGRVLGQVRVPGEIYTVAAGEGGIWTTALFRTSPATTQLLRVDPFSMGIAAS